MTCLSPRYFALFLLLPAGPALAADRAPIEAKITASHRGGDVVYRYQLTNPGRQPIDRVYLGCDCRTSGVGQLQTLPAGAVATEEDERGWEIEVPDTAIASPPGWRAQVRMTVEGRYWVEWRRVDAAARADGLEAFAVTIPGDDNSFLRADVTVVTLAGGDAASHLIPLRISDNSPPKIEVSANTSSADPTSLNVATLVTVKDEVDPEPRVWMESFESEKNAADGGRRYRITYGAADASGNRSRASFDLAESPPPEPVRLPAQAFLP